MPDLKGLLAGSYQSLINRNTYIEITCTSPFDGVALDRYTFEERASAEKNGPLYLPSFQKKLKWTENKFPKLLELIIISA